MSEELACIDCVESRRINGVKKTIDAPQFRFIRAGKKSGTIDLVQKNADGENVLTFKSDCLLSTVLVFCPELRKDYR